MSSVVEKLGLSRNPGSIVPFLAGATSIASLLGYFYGFFSMGDGVAWALVPGIATAVAFIVAARCSGHIQLADRALAGIFAGGLATLAYDLCRIPLVHSGLPIFKAISYFGTLIVGSGAVTAKAEVVGWAYHYTNGVGFALMYAALFARERLWTAILWGTALEGAMLLTPYAEVFGYTRGREFLAITLGAHFVYGAALWAGLRLWQAPALRSSLGKLMVGFVFPALGVALVGADFHRTHAADLPPSPPSRMGPHLYTTWNTLEVDRVVTLWLIRRFHDPKAHFALLPPFTKTPYGVPIDVPESEIRRSGAASAAEVAIGKLRLDQDERLVQLGKIATFFEIHPWALAPPGATIGDELRDRAGACGTAPTTDCLEGLFDVLDDWYDTRSTAGPSS